jgi:hypothetical protein
LFQTEQCKEYKSQDTALVKRAINIEGFTVEGPDQGEAIQCFIKIEGTSKKEKGSAHF